MSGEDKASAAKQREVREKAVGATTGLKSKSPLGEDKASAANQLEVRENAAGAMMGSKSKSPSGEDKASAANQWEVREKAAGAMTGSKSKLPSGEDKASAAIQEDALKYLAHVKKVFVDSPDIHKEFVNIYKTFHSKTINTHVVIHHAVSLFQGNKQLVLGFNTFLPKGYCIELSTNGSSMYVYREPGRSGVSDIYPQLGALGIIDISPQFAPHMAALGDGTLGEGIREGEGKNNPPEDGFHCQGVEHHAPFLHGGPVPCQQEL